MSLYPNIRYARAENVKASSTLIAADEIVDQLMEIGLLDHDLPANHDRYSHRWQYLAHNSSVTVDKLAHTLAAARGFPVAMAKVNNSVEQVTINSSAPV